MNQDSHIISQQVFGSSKKLQFIGVPPMDSLLNAIDRAHCIQLPKPTNTTKRNMSIESMLDSDATFEHDRNQQHRSSGFKSTYSASTPTAVKRPWLAAPYDDRLHKHRRHEHGTQSPSTPALQQQQLTPKRLTTVTCYHAAVAQKSYGSEKRFLCPPPTIAIQHHHQHSSTPAITMSVLAEGSERPVEQRTSLDENNTGNFKYLHVTGSAKTKQFCLRVNMFHSSTPSLSSPLNQAPPIVNMNGPPFATFFSSPISIISKPSKKTAKARNVSSCIFTTSQISLFNRINSQTVRTKYLTSASSSENQDKQELCAKNSSWSPFDVVLVRQPTPPPQHTLSHNHHHYHHHHQPSVATAGVPLTYGTEIILKDSRSGVCSPPVIIRKVDKGAISSDAFGPVSQMQKIALQLASSVDSADGGDSVYLSANGNAMQEATTCQDHLEENGNNNNNNNNSNSNNNNGSGNGINHAHASTWLDYCVSKRVSDSKNKDGSLLEKVDDYLCWTIVGIAKFEYTIDEPIMPPAPTVVTTTSNMTALSPSLSPLSPMASPPPSSFYSTHRPPTTTPPSPPYHHHHHQQNNNNNSNNKYHRQPEIMPRLLQPSPPPSPPRTIVPFPMVSTVSYVEEQHALALVGQHLVQHLPSSAYPHLLEFWLGGAHGPLPSIKQQQHSITNGNIELTLALPNTQDFLVAHHDLLVKNSQKGDRLLELPLLMVRKDNVVYHSGKSIACHVKPNGDTHWTIVDVPVAKP